MSIIVTTEPPGVMTQTLTPKSAVHLRDCSGVCKKILASYKFHEQPIPFAPFAPFCKVFGVSASNQRSNKGAGRKARWAPGPREQVLAAPILHLTQEDGSLTLDAGQEEGTSLPDENLSA